MSADRNSKSGFAKRFTTAKPADMLADMLDFGPETAIPTSNEVNQRILRIVKTLKELSDRIDKLAASRF
jgi:hypothetical protein